MTREQFLSFFFIALLVFVVYEIFQIFSPFVQSIFWSAILAFTFYPVHVRIRKSLMSHPTLAAILTTLLIFLIVVPAVSMIIINVATQAIELYQAATAYVREGRLGELVEQIRSLRFIQNIETHVSTWEPLKENATNWLLATTRTIGTITATQVATITKNLFLVILNLVFMFFLLFVFLKDGEGIYKFIYQITPLEEKTKRDVFRQINETFSAVIRGQVLTSVTQAVLAGVIYWGLGLPLPIFFAAATFLTSLIPIMGAASVWVPLVIYLVITAAYIKAVVLFFLGIFGISLIDNIMKPALIGERTKLSYFLLFFGILGGMRLYGILGIFLAPVVLSLFFALVKIYQEEYK